MNEYDGDMAKIVLQRADDLVTTGKDINTVIRETQEQMDKFIQSSGKK